MNECACTHTPGFLLLQNGSQRVKQARTGRRSSCHDPSHKPARLVHQIFGPWASCVRPRPPVSFHHRHSLRQLFYSFLCCDHLPRIFRHRSTPPLQNQPTGRWIFKSSTAIGCRIRNSDKKIQQAAKQRAITSSSPTALARSLARPLLRSRCRAPTHLSAFPPTSKPSRAQDPFAVSPSEGR
jgi:hypothetical protein